MTRLQKVIDQFSLQTILTHILICVIWIGSSIGDGGFWGPSEPTSAEDSDSRGECVDLDPSSGYMWNDNPCSLSTDMSVSLVSEFQPFCLWPINCIGYRRERERVTKKPYAPFKDPN